MPKRQIIDLPGDSHFVTFSTYQRRRFLETQRAREIMADTLQACLEKHQTLCHGFVVMPNHVHALLTPDPSVGISSFLLAWKKTSSYRIKQFYVRERTQYLELCPKDSPIWQAKFYDFNLSSTGKFQEKLDYMHDNPVTAGLVLTTLDWAWSSARFYERGENVGVNITPW
jgi:putative transposase